MTSPTELVAVAEYEIKIFERPSAIISQALLDEVRQLRAQLQVLCDAADRAHYDSEIMNVVRDVRAARSFLPK